jgi:hypothetical protein
LCKKAQGVSEHLRTSFLKTSAILVGYLHIGRSQEVELVGDPLHLATEAVAEAAGEVDEAAGKLALSSLEVEDDGDTGHVLVGYLLGLVEGDRRDGVGLGARLRHDGPHHGTSGTKRRRFRLSFAFSLTRKRPDGADRGRLGVRSSLLGIVTGYAAAARLCWLVVVIVVVLIVGTET